MKKTNLRKYLYAIIIIILIIAIAKRVMIYFIPEELELSKHGIFVIREISSTDEQIPLNIGHDSEMIWVFRYDVCTNEGGVITDYNISEYAGKNVLIKEFDVFEISVVHTHAYTITYDNKVICAYKNCEGGVPGIRTISGNCL